MTEYSKLSPWSKTSQNSLYLELIQLIPVPSETDDHLYVIESQYKNRPDLLSYDLYGTPKLWWVFVQRNMEVIKDPIYDFVPGISIYLPKKSNLNYYLGI